MTDTTDPQAEQCPGCQHPQHAPGAECDQRVEHDGQRNWHLCLCLNRQYADRPCSPLMTCQGGALGYGDIWYLQRGHSLSSANGVITPEVLATTPTPSAAAPSAPDDRAALRDLAADALADAEGWQWAPGYDKAQSPTYQHYLRQADAVLAVLPAPADADLRRQLAAAERIRENADFHLGQEMARRQLAEKETGRLRAVVARLRQMTDHWEQQLPEVIRTPAVVSAIRAVLEAADDPSRMAGEAQQPETQADDEPPCTCVDAGDCFAPAGHYADCPAAVSQPGKEA
jgi:hypothetical protein